MERLKNEAKLMQERLAHKRLPSTQLNPEFDEPTQVDSDLELD